MPVAFVVLIKRLSQGSWLHFKMQEILEWETGTVEVHQHQGIFFAWKLLLHFIPKLSDHNGHKLNNTHLTAEKGKKQPPIISPSTPALPAY